MVLPNHTVVTTLGLPERKPSQSPYVLLVFHSRLGSCFLHYLSTLVHSFNILTRSTTQTLPPPPHPHNPNSKCRESPDTHTREENMKKYIAMRYIFCWRHILAILVLLVFITSCKFYLSLSVCVYVRV